MEDQESHIYEYAKDKVLRTRLELGLSLINILGLEGDLIMLSKIRKKRNNILLASCRGVVIEIRSLLAHVANTWERSWGPQDQSMDVGASRTPFTDEGYQSATAVLSTRSSGNLDALGESR